MTAGITGSVCTRKRLSEYQPTNLERDRDTTYPAGAAITTDAITVAPVTSTLFSSQSTMSVLLNIFVKLANVGTEWRPPPTPLPSASSMTAPIGTRTMAVMTTRAATRSHV